MGGWPKTMKKMPETKKKTPIDDDDNQERKDIDFLEDLFFYVLFLPPLCSVVNFKHDLKSSWKASQDNCSYRSILVNDQLTFYEQFKMFSGNFFFMVVIVWHNKALKEEKGKNKFKQNQTDGHFYYGRNNFLFDGISIFG